MNKVTTPYGASTRGQSTNGESTAGTSPAGGAAVSRRRWLGAAVTTLGAVASLGAVAACTPPTMSQVMGPGWNRADGAAKTDPSGPTPTPPAGPTTYRATGPARAAAPFELPLRLVIPKLGVDAPIIAVGLTREGGMDVPQQAHEVGWYQHSERPGHRGNAVLAGHLDWYGVSGVFRRLAQMEGDDRLVIISSDGQERLYTVEWQREFLASNAIAVVGEVFEPLERAVLTLITCGGRWNALTQRYDSRVVVRARGAAAGS